MDKIAYSKRMREDIRRACPLMGTLKPQSNTMVGTLAIDGWAATFGTARRGLGGALLTVSNVTAHAPINGQYTNFILFGVAL